MKKRLALAGIVIVVVAASASAHRLDEYLQATRIGVEIGRIDLEVDLTPGAAIADSVVETIDLDGDGTLSNMETAAYAASVVRSLSLSIDGRSLDIALSNARFPTIDEMRRGEGVIRLRARAVAPNVDDGRHRIDFKNNHRPDIAVYLVNAFMPTDERIHITGQSRDVVQREGSVDYLVSKNQTNPRLASALPLILGLAIAAMLCAVLRGA